MFYLTYRGFSWAKKSFEKTGGQRTFWLERKNGQNHGSAILGVKKGEIQNFFFFNSLLIYAPLMIKVRIFSQTYHNGARSNHSSGPKSAYFSPKT